MIPLSVAEIKPCRNNYGPALIHNRRARIC